MFTKVRKGKKQSFKNSLQTDFIISFVSLRTQLVGAANEMFSSSFSHLFHIYLPVSAYNRILVKK